MIQNQEQFQKEQNELLKTVLDLRFFLPWKDMEIDECALQHDAQLELYITSQCNQKCKYCYLQQFEQLYPHDILDHNLILHNLKLLYDWILENNFHIAKIEFFSGEIWHTQFGLDILELSLEYLKKGMDVKWWCMATNCYFIFDKIQTQKIQMYINEFSACESPLQLSISVDGGIIEQENRPTNNLRVRDDEYWDNLFTFAKFNNFCFHPMVAAITIEKWIDNFKWFEKKFKEYNMNIWDAMFLEVRNDDWTEEKISSYIKFLNYMLEFYYKTVCNNDVKTFSNHLFYMRDTTKNQLSGYIPFALTKTDSFIGCTQATDLTVRLGDLAICPCHRLAYDKYLYGYFTVKDDKIDDIIANNPQVAIEILMANINLTSFKCDTCLYNKWCLKGCRGMQYETMGDPFIPNPNICTLLQHKYDFILEKYEELKVFDYLKTVSSLEECYDRVQEVLHFFEQWKEKRSVNNGMGKNKFNVSK